MPKRTMESVLNAPSVQVAIQEEKQRRQAQKVEEARNTIAELEQQYEHAKEVFFKVNGAKRILKNLG
jgi:hypothetical protein